MGIPADINPISNIAARVERTVVYQSGFIYTWYSIALRTSVVLQGRVLASVFIEFKLSCRETRA